ncbi:AI-2E family transporter [Halodesulfovibrio marinisediminis]|uniref:Predicted PurR-regulated permease PerM n=1 Tax=Halodesulfovibrio marinisediminis DSM 17456 TaxID=1121457 RepID=A0A1N6DG13_9BACT|nr:AI-2E family transporter [Halodesulfovibrio marinisediminis]SIN69623.1 Predicted PurR-regulated permease PerM [Halodesulfovibrio marinisediminis DSM 17456]
MTEETKNSTLQCKSDHIGPTLKFPRNNLFRYFTIILLTFSLYLAYLIAAPFLHTIILSIVVAACCYPVYKRILAIVHGREIWAATISILLLVLCIAVPLTFFITSLIPQAVDSVHAVTTWLQQSQSESFLADIQHNPTLQWLHEKLPFFDINEAAIKSYLATISKTVGQQVVTFGTSALGDTLNFVAKFLLMLLIVFFLLKDGNKMIAGLKYLWPMRESQEDALLHSLRSTSRAVLVGGLLVAIIQGLVGGIGLAFVGITPLFWGTVMSFCSLIPIAGTGIVWIPASLYLLVTSGWQPALFMVLWGAIPVAAVDSFLRPYFMRESSGVSVFFIFLSILGGLKAFGMLGILYGPLILSFVMVMLKIYGEEYHHVLSENSRH